MVIDGRNAHSPETVLAASGDMGEARHGLDY